jgi:hypothetical protein
MVRRLHLACAVGVAACAALVAAAACVPGYSFVDESDGGPPPRQDGGPPPQGDGGPRTDGANGGGDAPTPTTDAGGPFFFEAGTPGCYSTIQHPGELTTHIAEGSLPSPAWDSNPPAGGPHYPIWAEWQDYTSPVPYGYLIHNMEHGAVVFFYRCPADAPCADVIAALQTAKAQLPSDTLCTGPDGGGEDPGVRTRGIIEPSATSDVLIAASAWGWQYRANCIDQASLNAFATAHYGNGPESLCSVGTTNFVTPDGGVGF